MIKPKRRSRNASGGWRGVASRYKQHRVNAPAPLPSQTGEPQAAPAKRRLKLRLAAPRGFCAGVDRAIQIVERALEKFGAPVYVRHEIVHNRHVVDRLKALGAVWVEVTVRCPGKPARNRSESGTAQETSTASLPPAPPAPVVGV